MDLNDLYQRRGESLLRARTAASEAARHAHAQLARLYGERIMRLRARALSAE
jgi:hypothetical protein